MNNIAFHDQCLAYIHGDSINTVIDGELSYSILADQFENYWRTVIGKEVADQHNLPTGLFNRVHPILKTIWKRDND